MKEEKILKLLEEVRDALKAVEGKFIYTNGENVPALENLLKQYPVKYVKSASLMADLYEFIVNANEDVWNEIKQRIISSGFKAYVSNTRLPVSGTIGTIQAIAEKAQLYGYNSDSGEWDWIKAVANKLAVYIDQIVKTSKAKKIIKLDLDSDTTLLAGQSESKLITPPTGKVYKLLDMQIMNEAPSGATTGDYGYHFKQEGYPRWIGKYMQTYSAPLYLASLGFQENYSSKAPADDLVFFFNLRDRIWTNSHSFYWTYINHTDVDQTNTRYVVMFVEEFDELT